MFGISSQSDKRVLVSGIQATGRLHIGNYFGAMKQNIDLANSGEFESFVFIADYHALTTVKEKEMLVRSTNEIAAAYIASGLDISKAILFRQSSVPEVTELAWIFNNIVSTNYLKRGTTFKDYAEKSGGEFSDKINVGIYTYPVLMAADILIYKADIVPVGQDQKQHLEISRDIAQFYNRAWGIDQFKLPKELIVESVAIIPGTDGEKMSKSKGNVIPLFGSDEEIKKAVMNIVTDSKTPGERKDPDTNNVYNIHKLFLPQSEDAKLRAKFEKGGYGYKEAKEELFGTIMKWREGKKQRFDDLMSHPEEIERILEEGGKKARARAQETMKEVRKQVGLQ